MPANLESVVETLKKLVDQGTITIKSYDTTGAAAISKATTLARDYPNRKCKLLSLEVTFSAAPTTSENFTVTRTTVQGNARPLTVLFSTNPSLTAATSILQIWEDEGADLEPGDEVTMAFTNTDAGTVKVVLKVEVLS